MCIHNVFIFFGIKSFFTIKKKRKKKKTVQKAEVIYLHKKS